MWTVTVYGGQAKASITYTLPYQPEDREVENLLAKHGATSVMIRNRNGS